MQRAEIVVRLAPGQPPRRGLVQARGGRPATLTVCWADGQEERLPAAGGPYDHVVPDKSLRLAWLLDREGLAARLVAEPVEVFVDAVRDAGQLTTAKIQKTLVDVGMDATVVKAAWVEAAPMVRKHPHIGVEGRTYRWLAEPLDVRMAELADEVAALRQDKARLEAMLRVTHQQQVALRTAQDRQLRIDAMRALAELAMEVEELVASGAESDIVVERVRILAQASSLEPIGQAGQETVFDPARHAPLAEYPAAGSAVSVVRPGYTWHAGDEDVLLGKAVVA